MTNSLPGVTFGEIPRGNHMSYCKSFQKELLGRLTSSGAS